VSKSLPHVLTATGLVFAGVKENHTALPTLYPQAGAGSPVEVAPAVLIVYSLPEVSGIAPLHASFGGVVTVA
jgi:hypothetical protein